MYKRLLIGLGLFVAVLLAIFLLAGSRSSAGFYQGKSLETWARMAYAGDGGALEAFQAMGTNAVPQLIQLLQVRDSNFRRSAWIRFRKLPLSFRRALPRIQGPDAPAIRGGAIRALGMLGPGARDAVPALGQVLCGSDHQARAEASAALARIGEPALSVLLEALANPSAEVRRAGVGALAQLGPEAQGAVPAVARLLLDSDESVRAAAAYALQAIGAPAAKTLGQAMEQGDDHARGAAVQALLAITRSLRQAEPGLVKMAQSDNPASRRQALEGLAAIHVPDNPTIQALTRGLSDPVLDVRLAAANGLANVTIRAQSAVPGLARCLEDPSPELRQAAARTLGYIGAPANAAVPELRTLLQDTNDAVRASAKEALGKIAP